MLVDGLLLRNIPLLPVQGDYHSVRSIIINCLLSSKGMPQGLKSTSSIINIGFEAREAAANTFTESQVDLNLSPLDNEVFVVLAINMDSSFPDNIAGTDTAVRAAFTTTSQATAAAIPSLRDPNCLSRLTYAVRSSAAASPGVSFGSQALETPPSTLDYIGIIATNDFFVQVEGQNNTSQMGMSGKVYGYRARADANTYAALVQSEVLSA